MLKNSCLFLVWLTLTMHPSPAWSQAIGTSFKDRSESDAGPQLLIVSHEGVGLHSDTPSSNVTRLTRLSYQQAGVAAELVDSQEIGNWIRTEAPSLQEAALEFKYIAFAKGHNAASIGEVRQYSPQESDSSDKSGYYGWILNLKRCSRTLFVPINKLSDGSRAVEFLDDVDILTPIDKSGRSPFRLDFDFRRPPGTQEARPAFDTSEPFLGVHLSSATEKAGCTIELVDRNSPAEMAGLLAGDVITGIGNERIASSEGLLASFEGVSIGQPLELAVLRNSATIHVAPTLTSARAYYRANASEILKIFADRSVVADENGSPTVMSDLLNCKTVVLYFWATWCPSCEPGLSIFQMASVRFGKSEFRWIGVSLDRDVGKWMEYVRRNQLGGVQLCAPKLARALGVAKVPFVALIRRNSSDWLTCDVEALPIEITKRQ